MSRDYAAVERELLDDLEARTGRDLAQWMAELDGLGAIDRNARIDWLRSAGFNFANASWLERIHHNGGKPIYVGRSVPPRRAEPARPREETAAAAPPPPPPAPLPDTAVPPDPPAVAPALTSEPDLAPLLAKAKAYRLLAEMLIAETRRAHPQIRFGIVGDVVTLGTTCLIGAMSATTKEVRLALDLGDGPPTPPFIKGKLSGSLASLGDVVVLTDARQIDNGLLDAIGRAARRLG